MKRVALYVRVSTAEQRDHGLSVDSQIEALREYCKEKGYKEMGLYNDAGISARKKYTHRPALLQLVEDCKEGRVDLILFTKLDRWFRSVADYYEVQKVLDEYKIPWRAIWEDYETETSAGVFKVNIMLSVAQTEADRTSERIKAVFEYKRANGQYVGGVPFGYIRVDGKLQKDPETEDLTNRIFETYLRTHSHRCVMDMEDFTFSRHVLTRIFKNPIYAGILPNGSGECPAYITKEQFDEIQEFKHKPVYRHKERIYLFSSLCVCSECGHRMHGTTSKNNSGFYKNYNCMGREHGSTAHRWIAISEKKLERYLIENLDEEINRTNEARLSVKTTSKARNFQAEKKKLQAKMERIGMRFELGDISVEEYKAKRNDVLDEIKKIDSECKNASGQAILPTLPKNWIEIYNDLDLEHQKLFWLNLIDTITVYRTSDKMPIIKLK